ncbi:hypothetical protein M7I_3405 [Glarea lozoyensis 74030]|uniref:Uncharacterized protein n=1 Tax=Glarea lozoyensis (strain ATCC 74030 / MF5533) TaxID=1104152 RepID=H0ELE2_GLAL7|nr:hypothetical protein M7I_3405 [Glarea lozoyensis 74030]
MVSQEMEKEIHMKSKLNMDEVDNCRCKLANFIEVHLNILLSPSIAHSTTSLPRRFIGTESLNSP